jgi:hypothetical protein
LAKLVRYKDDLVYEIARDKDDKWFEVGDTVEYGTERKCGKVEEIEPYASGSGYAMVRVEGETGFRSSSMVKAVKFRTSRWNEMHCINCPAVVRLGHFPVRDGGASAEWITCRWQVRAPHVFDGKSCPRPEIPIHNACGYLGITMEHYEMLYQMMHRPQGGGIADTKEAPAVPTEPAA